jgi:hypothetical protein
MGGFIRLLFGFFPLLYRPLTQLGVKQITLATQR